MKIDIIYQNNDLIAVNKPAGVSVTRDRTGRDDIVKILSEQLPAEDIRIVHRLDKETSGVMLFALNQDSQRRLSGLFAKGKIKKTYLALVGGFPAKHHGLIKDPLSQPLKGSRQMRIDPRHGKPAVTEYKVLADFVHYTLLAVYPHTGRTHQIRVHLAHRGMPLAVDPIYASEEPVLLSSVKPGYRQSKNRPESPLMHRLTLHAYQIELPGENGQTAIYTAKPDKKFSAALKMLTKHNTSGPEAFDDISIFDKIIAGETINVF